MEKPLVLFSETHGIYEWLEYTITCDGRFKYCTSGNVCSQVNFALYLLSVRE